MKMFVETEFEAEEYVLTPLSTDSQYLHRYGEVYEVPKGLARKHERATKALAKTNAEIVRLINEQEAMKSPQREEIEARRTIPQVSIYQLRHVKTRIVYTELTVPSGSPWAWAPQPGAEPDGWCQWYAKHIEDADFHPFGEPIRYDGKRK